MTVYSVTSLLAHGENGRLTHERTAADGLVIEVRKQYDVNGRVA